MEGVVCTSAQVCFSGHDHNLQWLQPSCGTEFIVSGAGSKNTPLRRRENNPACFESDADIGFMWVGIDGNRFTGAFYDSSGRLLYTKSIRLLRSREKISVTVGWLRREAMQGARRSHSELWRRRTTRQRARLSRSNCYSYF